MGENRQLLILVVEDEFLIRELMRVALADAGFATAEAESATEAVDMMRRIAIDGLVTDINLGVGPSGWDVAKFARELTVTMPVVYVTGGSAGQWRSNGVSNSALLEKPFAVGDVVGSMHRLLETRH